MEIGPKFSSFNIIAKGMRIQKKRMDLVAENIANTETTKTEKGIPYQRKFLTVSAKDFQYGTEETNIKTINLTKSKNHHLPKMSGINNSNFDSEISLETKTDESMGDLVYMPEHPDADENGYLQRPNVNIVTEMVDMIAATRGFEANVTAFNGAKQIAKDSLEI